MFAYVTIEVVFASLVILVCLGWARKQRRELRREVRAEANARIEMEVRDRTEPLEATVALYRTFVENTDAIAFEYSLTEQRLTYIAPQVSKLLSSNSNRSRREFLGTLIHRDDRDRVQAALNEYASKPAHERVALQYRLVRDDGKLVYLRTLLSDHTTTGLIRGVSIDLTAQTKLETEVRQVQKLESVGRLAAGVAHEINTPVQYVQDSVQFVREAVDELFGVLDKNGVQDEEADLDYLREHVPAALDRALDGLSRVTTIVHSLKAFAHPDQRKRTAVDINAAIENTLEIARNEYKYLADVELDLYELPRVDCFAGEINQVLLNLIVNAAHAIEAAKDSEGRGMISVRTRTADDHVEIAISDTGCGIPEEVRERIFEPFFTTKPVGKGTGQGLSIARQVVVDKHGGSLSFDTAVGIGTTFTIRLPLAATQVGVAA